MKRGPRAAGRALATALALLLAALAPTTAATAQEVAVEDLETQSPEPLAPPPPGVAATPEPPPSGSPAELEAAAEARYLEGDLAGAAALYRQLAVGTSAATERMRLLISAAWLDHQLGRYTDALELLSQGLADVTDYPFQAQNYSQDFVDLYARARERALAERRARAGELVQRSLSEIGSEQLPRARATLQQALALTPDDPFALFNLALVEMRTDRREEALAGFERLVAMDAGRPGSVPREVMAPALASLGLLYYDKEYLEDARRYLELSTDIDPNAARTWNNLGLTLRRMDEPAEAEAAFRRALVLSPNDAQVANNLALMLLAAQRHREAVTLLDEVTGRGAGDAAVWLNLGLGQRGQGDLGAAAASLARVIALDPDNRQGMAARGATYLAIVRFEQGDQRAAEEAALQALAWNPADVEAWVYRGLARHALGDPAGARDAFREAARLEPTRAEIHNNLGTALVALGDLAGAQESFSQALAIRPGFAEAQANLDQVTAQLARGATPPSPARQVDARPSRQNKFIGVSFDDNDFGYLGIKGALVESVSGDSPAARAGLRKGDVVLGVDGRKIEGPQDLLRYIARVTEKDYVELDIVRESRPQRLRVQIY